MIFPKDKDVGEFVKPWPRGKIPMCLLPLLIPTTFVKKDCWWLRQLIVLGSGVAGLSVLTHTHTPPQLTSLTEEIRPFPRRAEAFTHFWFLSIHAQARSCSSSLRGHRLSIILTHRLVYPRSSSSTDSVDSTS